MMLKVEEADWNEVFIDTVRIPADHRRHQNGTKIKNGSIVRLCHNGKTAFAVARGLPGRNSEAVIYMDEFIRDRLRLKKGSEVGSTNIRGWARRAYAVLPVRQQSIGASAGRRCGDFTATRCHFGGAGRMVTVADPLSNEVRAPSLLI